MSIFAKIRLTQYHRAALPDDCRYRNASDSELRPNQTSRNKNRVKNDVDDGADDLVIIGTIIRPCPCNILLHTISINRKTLNIITIHQILLAVINNVGNV